MKVKILKAPKQFKKGGVVPQFPDGGIFDDFRNKLSEFDSYNEENYKDSLGQYSKLNTKLGLLNALSLGANTAFAGMQSDRVEPGFNSTSGIDRMYSGIAPAVLKENIEGQRSQVSGMANQMLKAGSDPNLVASYLSPLSSRQFEVEGDTRFKNLQYQNNLDQQKAAFRNQILNKNLDKGAAAENQQVTNQNQKIGIIGRGVDSFIDNLGKGAVDKVTNMRSALAEYNNNRLASMRNEFGLGVSELGYNQAQEDLDLRKKQFEESLKQKYPSVTPPSGGGLPGQAPPPVPGAAVAPPIPAPDQIPNNSSGVGLGMNAFKKSQLFDGVGSSLDALKVPVAPKSPLNTTESVPPREFRPQYDITPLPTKVNYIKNTINNPNTIGVAPDAGQITDPSSDAGVDQPDNDVSAASYRGLMNRVEDIYYAIKRNTLGNTGEDQTRLIEMIKEQIGEEAFNKLVLPNGRLNIEWKKDPEIGTMAPFVKGTNTPVIPKRKSKIITPLKNSSPWK